MPPASSAQTCPAGKPGGGGMRVTGAPCVQAAPQSREPQCPPLPPPPRSGGSPHSLPGRASPAPSHWHHRNQKGFEGGRWGSVGGPRHPGPTDPTWGGEVLAHLDCQGVMTPSSGPPISTRLWIRSRFRFQSGVNKGLTRGCRHPIVHLGVGGVVWRCYRAPLLPWGEPEGGSPMGCQQELGGYL